MKISDLSETVIKTLELLENSSLTRKELAESLDMSIPKVGAYASELISAGIIREYKRNTQAPGRNSMALIPSRQPVFVIAEILADRFTASYFGYDLKTAKTDYHVISEPIFMDDEFTGFLTDIARRKPSVRGIGIVSDGFSDGREIVGSTVHGIDHLPLAEMVREHLSTETVLVENKSYWSLSDKSGINVIYSESSGNAKFTLIHDGILLSGRSGHAGNIGSIPGCDNRYFLHRLRYAENFDEYTSALADLFNTVIILCDPHRIYIQTDRYSSTGEIIKTVTEKLIVDHRLDLPELPLISGECETFDPTLPDLRRRLRDSSVISSLER